MTRSPSRSRPCAGLAQAAGILCLLSAVAVPVSAQPIPNPNPTTDTEKNSRSTARSSDSGAETQGRGSSQVDSDPEMMKTLAQSNLSETATGKLALEKSKDPKITQFAQRMIDDHTKALEDLKPIAQARGVELPTEPDLAHKAMSTAMSATAGNFFDKRYIQHAGVGDHERNVEYLRKVRLGAKDPGLRSYAEKVLPVVEQHLVMARTLERAR